MMIVLPSIDEQRSIHILLMLSSCTKASFAETSREQPWKDFAIKKHCRILIETKLIYLFNAVSLTMTIFADYSSLLFTNNFVVNAM